MTLMQTKVSLSNFNPKLMLGKLYPEGAPPLPELLLGRVYGIANGVKKGFEKDGVTPSDGMSGNFEIEFIEQKNKDGSKAEGVASGVCYLPNAFMDPILHMLADEVDKDGVVVKEGVNSVQFAYDVFIIPANNPAKYSWQLRTRLEASANDPLAALKSQAQGLLEAPKETVAEEAPAPKGKK